MRTCSPPPPGCIHASPGEGAHGQLRGLPGAPPRDPAARHVGRRQDNALDLAAPVGHWFHYSADYRIGTRYLAEHILDNIKFKIMSMADRFVADLLRSDSIYIEHNISVDNLEPVSTFLGMYGDPDTGGLDKQTFLERQKLYRDAEVESMLDVPDFIAKGWRLYGCESFVNDASGSLCEVVDLDDPGDRVLDR